MTRVTSFLKNDIKIMVEMRKMQFKIYEEKNFGRVLKYLEPTEPGILDPLIEEILQGEIACSIGMKSDAFLMGVARVLKDKRAKREKAFHSGEILVTEKTDPSCETIMIKSRVIITDVGGVLSHAAVESRNMKIPCIINTHHSTELIPDGVIILIRINPKEDYLASIFRITSDELISQLQQ